MDDNRSGWNPNSQVLSHHHLMRMTNGYCHHHHHHHHRPPTTDEPENDDDKDDHDPTNNHDEASETLCPPASDATPTTKPTTSATNTTTTPPPTPTTTTTQSTARTTITSSSSPRKKRTKLNNTSPKDILGPVDSFSEFHQARRALNQRVPWFQDHPIPSNLPMKYLASPPLFDWEKAGHKEMDQVFAFWKMNNGRTLGRRQIPKCLLLDSKTEQERLVVLNWWRSKTGDQQVEISSHQGLQRYYRAPKRSASPFHYAQRRHGLHALDLRNELEYKADREARVELAKELEVEKAAAIPTATPATAVPAIVSVVPDAADRNDDDNDDNGTDEQATTTLDVTTTTTTKSSSGAMKTSFVRPTVTNAPLGFKTIQSTYDLVQRFNLSVDILYCARTIPQDCVIENCTYPALDQNRGCCPLHKQNWWVRKVGAQPQRRRGHLLLGPEYATRRTVEDVVALEGVHKVIPMPCGCNSELCEGIGWSADMVRVPKQVLLPKQVVPGEHRDKDRPLRLAPWHFPPQSRIQLPDGTWKVVFGTKPEHFVLPDYEISEFLKEPGMIEYQQRKSSWLLPEWVYEMQAAEQGPPTLAEYQQAEFRTQQKKLMLQATMAILYHRDLIQSHSEAISKIRSMKKNYIHKKRVAVMLSPRKKRMTERGAVFETGVPEEDDTESPRNEGTDDPSHRTENGSVPAHSTAPNVPADPAPPNADVPANPAPPTVPANPAPPDMARIPNLFFAPGGSSLLGPQHAQLHAALGGLHPYTGDSARLEEAANRVWGHYYANYGRQI